MKAPNTNRISRSLLLLLAVSLLAGCGASSTSRSGSGSTLTPNVRYTYTGSSQSSTIADAECNMFDSRDIRLTGKVTTHYYNNTLQEDKIRLRITALSDRFDNSSNVIIKLFRWKASGNSGQAGTVDLDQTPLDFIVEKGTNGSVAISNSMNSINISTVNQLRQSNSISGTTAAEFFNQTVLVVSGVDYNWDALKIVLYDGSSAIGSADLLLPVFAANPNTYASSHPNVLAQLHPFWSTRTQSLTESGWGSRAQSNCF